MTKMLPGGVVNEISTFLSDSATRNGRSCATCLSASSWWVHVLPLSVLRDTDKPGTPKPAPMLLMYASSRVPLIGVCARLTSSPLWQQSPPMIWKVLAPLQRARVDHRSNPERGRNCAGVNTSAQIYPVATKSLLDGVRGGHDAYCGRPVGR